MHLYNFCVSKQLSPGGVPGGVGLLLDAEFIYSWVLQCNGPVTSLTAISELGHSVYCVKVGDTHCLCRPARVGHSRQVQCRQQSVRVLTVWRLLEWGSGGPYQVMGVSLATVDVALPLASASVTGGTSSAEGPEALVQPASGADTDAAAGP
jgi:hypothetical protein